LFLDEWHAGNVKLLGGLCFIHAFSCKADVHQHRLDETFSSSILDGKVEEGLESKTFVEGRIIITCFISK